MCSEDKYDDKKIRERLVQHLLLEHEAHFDNQEDAADTAENEAELGASVVKDFSANCKNKLNTYHNIC